MNSILCTHLLCKRSERQSFSFFFNSKVVSHRKYRAWSFLAKQLACHETDKKFKKNCMQVKKSTKLASDFHFYFNNDGIFVIPHQNDSQRNSLIIVVLVVWCTVPNRNFAQEKILLEFCVHGCIPTNFWPDHPGVLTALTSGIHN